MGTETWLSPDVSNNEIIPSNLNYNIYRNDCADGYDGVMLAITSQIPSLEVPNLITKCEIVGLRLTCLIAINYLWVDIIGRTQTTSCQLMN